MESRSGRALQLDSEVQFLKGVGPVRARLLSRLGVETLEDLLHHYPHDYLERGRLGSLAQAAAGHKLTATGQVADLQERSIRGRRSMLNVVLADGGHRLQLTWFNAGYLARYLHVGDQIVVSGIVSRYRGRLQMVNPEFEAADEGGELTRGQPLPRYPLTAGIQPAAMRRMARGCLDAMLEQVEDPVPPQWIQQEGLTDLRTALRAVHAPQDLEEARLGRQRLAFDEALALQLSVGVRRRTLLRRESAVNVGKLGDLSTRYVSSLGFELTEAQRRTLVSIKADLGAPYAMHRLLQGDVGSGKTLVALIAMLWMAESGGQAAFMAPTEVLARQHALRHIPEFAKFGLRVELLTGSTPAAEKRQIIGGLRSGAVAAVFGTHALIQEGVEFARLGLAVVDEQHRFGVVQRAALSGGGAHMLVMSATPIPRSLAMTVYADLDLSIIDQLPPGRTPVETHVVDESRLPEVYARLRPRLEAGEQAFLVFPLVEESETSDGASATAAFTQLTRGPLKGFRVGLLHGKLPAKDKARISAAFAAGELQAVVATTVVEVGIDVPAASMMIVHNAERFGLAQLHQLRGRVGRGATISHCVLAASPEASPDAQRRLQVVAGTHDGFELAEADLRERGMGDLIGTRQHGALPLRLLNPLVDAHLVERSRHWAEQTLERDPLLRDPAHRRLGQWLDRLGRRNPFWSTSG